VVVTVYNVARGSTSFTIKTAMPHGSSGLNAVNALYQLFDLQLSSLQANLVECLKARWFCMPRSTAVAKRSLTSNISSMLHSRPMATRVCIRFTILLSLVIWSVDWSAQVYLGGLCIAISRFKQSCEQCPMFCISILCIHSTCCSG
jgi:hypothetical protein